MKLTLKEKIEKRARIFKGAENMVKKSKREKRAMTDDESKKFDRMNEAVDRLTRDIQTETRLLEMKNKVQVGTPSSGEDIQDTRAGAPSQDEQRKAAFETYLKSGEGAVKPEQRSLLADSEKQGGYITAPQQFIIQLITDLDDTVFVRKLANVIKINSGDSIGAPSLEEDFEDAEWTNETSTGKETDAEFSKRELKTNPLNKRVKVTTKLLRNSAISVETLVRDRLRYRFGVTEEKAYLVGDGHKKPLGMFTASQDGISTNRDITGKLDHKTLIDVQHKVKMGYWKDSTWILHPDVLAEIRKLENPKDGKLIWQPSLTVGVPDKILNRPYQLSEYAPNDLKKGYALLFGNLKFYWILDSLLFEIKRADERYIEESKVGFFGYKETDGMPVLESAFARLKLST